MNRDSFVIAQLSDIHTGSPFFDAQLLDHAVEEVLSLQPDLVDGAAVSRWASLKELDAAIESRAASESLVRLLPLLRLEPVTRTYEILA